MRSSELFCSAKEPKSIKSNHDNDNDGNDFDDWITSTVQCSLDNVPIPRPGSLPDESLNRCRGLRTGGEHGPSRDRNVSTYLNAIIQRMLMSI